MTTINDTYINAILADAAYVSNLNLTVTPGDLTTALTGRMTPTVAKYIGDNFSVVNQIGGLASSFDATVWRGNAGTPYAGQVYVSMRGTQEGPDFGADGDLAASGLAHQQLAAMVNWWLRETTLPLTDADTPQYVSQIRVTATGDFVAAPSALGTGNLVGIGNIKSVNGHSLGGYLASAFVRLFGNQQPPIEINTFNSAGFSKPATLNIENGFSQITQLIGSGLGLGHFSSAQNNYYAQNGINVTTNTWDPVGFKQYGTRTSLFQEDLTPQGINNHYMYKLTDLLALGNVLSKLDPTLDLAKLSTLVSAGSNVMSASYEGVLDGVRKMFLGTSATPTQTGDANASNSGPQPAARLDYQAKLKALADLFAEPSGTLKFLAGKLTLSLPGSSLATTAKTDFAAFLSLSALSPIVISTTDTTAIAKLKQANETLAQQWEADLALTAPERSQGKANFSDVYLADRQALLQAIVTRNKQDNTNGLVYDALAPADRALAFQFSDEGSTNQQTLLTQRQGGAVSKEQRIVFGTAQAETITGTDNALGDHLYGGAGNDTLNGNAGNDYLEGNTGNDTLDGGAGDDTLLGGAGSDTYQFTGAWGKDTILDSDGLGNISINAELLSTTKASGKRGSWTARLGGEFVGLSVFNDASSSTGQKLAISKADGSASITISNFDVAAAKSSAGYLGIKLDTTEKLALTEGASQNVWQDYDFNASSLAGKSSNIVEGTGKTFSIALSAAVKAGDTITLALAGAASGTFKAILGDDTVAANGAVLTLVEGQTSVSFALVQEGDITQDLAGTLSASYQGTGADANAQQSASSNSWALNLKDTGETTKTFLGDQRAKLYGVEINPEITPSSPGYNTYAWSTTSWATDGTLTGGITEENFADVIYGSTGNDRIDGKGGNDALDGGDGNDQIDGGTGNDLIAGGAGSDNIKGGDGDDIIFGATTLTAAQRRKADEVYVPPAGGIARPGGGPTWAFYTQGNNNGTYGGVGSLVPMDDAPDVVDGGAGNDEIYGGRGVDKLKGGDGNDFIVGHGGNDVIEGNDGNDTLWGDGIALAGRNGSTPVELHGDDFIDGGAGNDFVWGGGGSDVLFGGTGDDELRGDATSAKSGDAGYVAGQYHGNDYLDGEEGDDKLLGDGGSDTLYGGTGDDQLFGDDSWDGKLATEFHGNDYLDGGAGNDLLVGGGKDDVLYGGDGNDELFGDDITTSTSSYTIDAAAHGKDYLDGGAGDDQLVGGGNDDTLIGGAGNDVLIGDGDGLALAYQGNDTLDGGDGNDTLYGDGGNDILLGGAGDDTLNGGEGDDVLDGGSGNNLLRGGAGNDRYIVHGGDQIEDTEGQSTLQMDARLADLKVVAASGDGDLVLQWDGGAAGVYLNGAAALGNTRLELADGTATTLRDLAATTLESVVNNYSFATGATLFGGKAADTLVAYGNGITASGGRGDDAILVEGSHTTVEYTRGDGVDTLSGYGSGAVIALSGDFNLDDFRLEVNASQQLSVRLRGDTDERMNLNVDLNNLAGNGLIERLTLNGQSLSFADLLARGVKVMGTAQDDTLTGTNTTDTIYTLAGNDSVDAGGGNDTILIGTGNKQLYGGAGADTYVIGGGNAAQTSAVRIDDSAGVNVIRLAGVSNWADVVLAQPVTGSNDLVFTLANGSGADRFTLTDGLLRADKFSIALADGQTRRLDSFMAGLASLDVTGSYSADVVVGSDQGDLIDGGYGNDLINGGAGNDFLLGGDGDDVLTGGTGDDILMGDGGNYGGNDTYVLGPNGGNDQIFDYVGTNTIRFVGGITPAQLSVERLGDSTDLRLRVDADNSVLIHRGLEGAISSYVFADGTTWSYAEVINRAAAVDGQTIAGDDLDNAIEGGSGADLLLGNRGNDVLRGYNGNDELLGGEGDDELIGGGGNDLLEGGAGNDTYRFALGDGVDKIIDADGNSAIKFGQGIALADLSATRVTIDGDNYVRLAYSASDAVLIKEGVALTGAAFGFADGTTLSQAQVYAQALTGSIAVAAYTAGADVIYGYVGDDTLYGGGGDDSLFGGKGDDVLNGGTGNDTLTGGAGHDTYVMGLNGGHDTIIDTSTEGSTIRLQQGDSSSLSYVHVGKNLLVTSAALNSSFYVTDFYGNTGSWTLKTATGDELDLRALAAAGMQGRTTEQRREDAYAGLVAKQPISHNLSDIYTEYTGNYYQDYYYYNRHNSEISFSGPGFYEATNSIGTEYRVTVNKVRKLTESDDATIDAFNQSVDVEAQTNFLRSTSYTVTSLVTRYTSNTTTTPGSSYEVTLPPGASGFGHSLGQTVRVTADHRVFIDTPGTSTTTLTPYTTTETSTYVLTTYRTDATATLVIEDVRGGDQANAINLSGSASKLVTAGGGDDVIIRIDGSGTGDWIDGGAGNDIIKLGSGNDELNGGTGNDYLDGAGGSDSYVISAGDDGWDIINDTGHNLVEVEFMYSYSGTDSTSAVSRQLFTDMQHLLINQVLSYDDVGQLGKH